MVFVLEPYRANESAMRDLQASEPMSQAVSSPRTTVAWDIVGVNIVWEDLLVAARVATFFVVESNVAELKDGAAVVLQCEVRAHFPVQLELNWWLVGLCDVEYALVVGLRHGVCKIEDHVLQFLWQSLNPLVEIFEHQIVEVEVQALNRRHLIGCRWSGDSDD